MKYKRNNYPTFIQVILKFGSFVLRNESLSDIQLLLFLRRRNAKENHSIKAKRVEINIVIKCIFCTMTLGMLIKPLFEYLTV